MASFSRLAQPTLANGILKTKTNTFFTKTVFPSVPFTNKITASNAHPLTKVTCVNGMTEISPCNHLIGTKTEPTPLKIGIIGFGNFGQFIAKGAKRQGHSVLATSRTDYSEYCKHNGMQFFRYCIL
jgi:NADP oxidoreductase coenzyme F420-dependent